MLEKKKTKEREDSIQEKGPNKGRKAYRRYVYLLQVRKLLLFFLCCIYNLRCICLSGIYIFIRWIKDIYHSDTQMKKTGEKKNTKNRKDSIQEKVEDHERIEQKKTRILEAC